jgi:hypothetical protein
VQKLKAGLQRIVLHACQGSLSPMPPSPQGRRVLGATAECPRAGSVCRLRSAELRVVDYACTRVCRLEHPTHVDALSAKLPASLPALACLIRGHSVSLCKLRPVTACRLDRKALKSREQCVPVRHSFLCATHGSKYNLD